MTKRRDAGSGGIEKTSVGTYKVVIDLGRDAAGKRVRYRRTFKTLKEAQRVTRDVLSKRDLGISINPNRLLVGDWIRGWLDRHLSEGHITASTHVRYEIAMRVHVLPVLGSLPIQQLRRDHVLDLRAAMIEGRDGRRPQSPASVKKTLGVLRQALDEAVKNSLIVTNPAQHVKAPPVSTAKEQRALNEDEITSLLKAAAGTRFDFPLRLTLSTGLRRGELLALTWNDIDLDEGRLNVRQAVSLANGEFSFHEPKSKSRRSISLSPATVQLLRRHRTEQNEQRLRSAIDWSRPELVAPSSIGTVWHFRRFLRGYRAVLARTDIGAPETVNWHTLRHTAASQWIASGASVFEVARRLGHSSTSTTERVYAHLLPRQDDVSAHALDHLLAL
jgi:integrase